MRVAQERLISCDFDTFLTLVELHLIIPTKRRQSS